MVHYMQISDTILQTKYIMDENLMKNNRIIVRKKKKKETFIQPLGIFPSILSSKASKENRIF